MFFKVIEQKGAHNLTHSAFVSAEVQGIYIICLGLPLTKADACPIAQLFPFDHLTACHYVIFVAYLGSSLCIGFYLGPY